MHRAQLPSHFQHNWLLLVFTEYPDLQAKHSTSLQKRQLSLHLLRIVVVIKAQDPLSKNYKL